MKDTLESLASEVRKTRNFDSPPLHLWNPPLSGDIAIQVEADGTWYHEGGKIERHSLVCLFASILRREEDGDYYLVTPQEKWRIEVALHPLLVTDYDRTPDEEGALLLATTNTDRVIPVSAQSPLFLDSAASNVAVLRLPHGLTAMSTRAAWYRLVAMADMEGDSAVLKSGEFILELPVT